MKVKGFFLLSLLFLLLTACGNHVPEAAPDPLAQGAEIYFRQCRSCHQVDGRGLLGGNRYAADFTEPNGVLTRPNEVLAQSILNGVEGKSGKMPAFKPILDQNEINAVLTYVRTTFHKETIAIPAEPTAAP